MCFYGGCNLDSWVIRIEDCHRNMATASVIHVRPWDSSSKKIACVFAITPVMYWITPARRSWHQFYNFFSLSCSEQPGKEMANAEATTNIKQKPRTIEHRAFTRAGHKSNKTTRLGERSHNGGLGVSLIWNFFCLWNSLDFFLKIVCYLVLIDYLETKLLATECHGSWPLHQQGIVPPSYFL